MFEIYDDIASCFFVLKSIVDEIEFGRDKRKVYVSVHGANLLCVVIESSYMINGYKLRQKKMKYMQL